MDETPETPDPFDQIKARLADPGWCVVRSSTLGAEVLWLRDNRVTFPRELGQLVSYTVDELLTLAHGIGPEDLRALYTAKKAFKPARLTQVRLLAEGDWGSLERPSTPSGRPQGPAVAQPVGEQGGLFA